MKVLLLVGAIVLMGMFSSVQNHQCDKLPMGIYRPPPVEDFLNYGVRKADKIDTLVIHYTEEDYAQSYYLLAHKDGLKPDVSVHYMVSPEGRIDDLVEDKNRAWHAGVSYWREEDGLNDYSIGIEIINLGSGDNTCYPVGDEKPPPPEDCKRHPFAQDQLDSLEQLIACILEEHPGIINSRIIGHQDIAPDRKPDPGIEFPWEYFAKKGYGIFSYKTEDNPSILLKYKDTNDKVGELKKSLHSLGYLINNMDDNFDYELAYVVRAFHMHYNQGIANQGAGWGDWNTIDQMRLDDLLVQIKEESSFKGLKSLLSN